MNFFRYFPVIDYVFEANTGNFGLNIVNTTVHVQLIESVKQVVTVFYDYLIQDGERPDTVSVNLYGAPDYTWIILLVNNIFSHFDWPLTQDEFVLYMTEKYGSLEAAQTTFIYQHISGNIVDATTYGLLSTSAQGPIITVYDNEVEQNELKRRIKVIPASFIGPVMSELKTVLAT